MRIFVGKTEIAGIAHGLSTGLRRLGHDAQLVLFMPHPFKYAEADTGLIQRIWMGLGGLVARYQHILPIKVVTWLMWRAWSWVVFLWALFRFDAYIFIFGRSITDSWLEDVIHRALGNKLVFIYCGSDIRPAYIDGPACGATGEPDVGRLASLSRKTAQRLHRRERLGFLSVNSPLTGQLHSRPYVNWFAMGVPRDIPASALALQHQGATSGDPIRILHSPSAPEIKGSAIIRTTVNRLRDRGHDIEFIELRNVPNSMVIDELRRCDFIVDQLYSDTPMAGFATEAAMVGKPAVVGSYGAALFNDHAAAWSLPPHLCVHPDALEDAIETMICDTERRRDLGRSAYEFVHTAWTLEAVAGRYLQLLLGNVPEAWLVQPGFEYVQGCGLAEERARMVVRRVVDKCGQEALQLQHCPALEAAFLRFATAERAG